MARRIFDLKTLLDIPQWEKVQDELARLTGTAIITIDFKGNPITKHSLRTDFCSVIRENPVSRKRCFRCDALAGLEAVRRGRPFIYLCHCGIVDVAVPVLVGDHYLGAVMFGQVRIPNGDPKGLVQRLVNEISSFQPESETARSDLMEMYEKLPEMEYSQIERVADLLNAMVNYIVDRAVNTENRALAYEHLLRSSSTLFPETSEDIRALEAAAPEDPDPQETPILPKSSPVYQAVDYVNTHRSQTITMKEMAQLCNLSPSYFSRLFQREMGENFISYVNRQKVQWAKVRLRESSDSISQIAADLGFVDSSYFISVFRKFEGITPTVYRQHKYR